MFLCKEILIDFFAIFCLYFSILCKQNQLKENEKQFDFHLISSSQVRIQFMFFYFARFNLSGDDFLCGIYVFLY